MSDVTIILFGATGDLSHRKLLPAFYSMLKHTHIRKFLFIGTAREVIDTRELFHQVFKDEQDSFVKELQERFYYMPLDSADAEGFKKLSLLIAAKEQEHGMAGNRIVYLAVPAELYCILTKEVVQAGIIERQSALQGIYHRIVYEKPFGWDLASAYAINTCIKELLAEIQIYRVDHYLTKALVTSIGLSRLSNKIFEPLWNNKHIDNVQIILSETDSIEGRGEFYDRYGALKDVVQNHMFQLLSLIAMEPPATLDPTHVSEAKKEVLKELIIKDGILGQYKGYREESGVNSDSTTETFAVLSCTIPTARWKGVPFYLKTGKCLRQKSTDIFITFKGVSRDIIDLPGTFAPNALTIRVSPNAGFSLQLNTQKGLNKTVVPITMNFCYRCVFGYEEPHSYERLFYNVIHGDKSISVSSEEIEYAWRGIEQIKKLQLPLYEYNCGTTGPEAAALFAKNHDFIWHL
jgi:glucose-6-phosphate 1-dehydrogenase